MQLNLVENMEKWTRAQKPLPLNSSGIKGARRDSSAVAIRLIIQAFLTNTQWHKRVLPLHID